MNEHACIKTTGWWNDVMTNEKLKVGLSIYSFFNKFSIELIWLRFGVNVPC